MIVVNNISQRFTNELPSIYRDPGYGESDGCIERKEYLLTPLVQVAFISTLHFK